MKKIVPMFVLSVMAINAHAQIKKNTFLLGGNILGNAATTTQNYQSNTENQQRRFLVMGASVGKAIKENNVLGINIGASFSDFKSESQPQNARSYKDNSFNAGVFYRKYKLLAKDFYFFGEATAGFGLGTQYNLSNAISAEYNRKTSSSYLSLTPGISYKVFKKMQLELSLPNVVGAYYAASNDKEIASAKTIASSKNFSINTGLSSQLLNNLSLGFRLFL